jgi:MscS family membrane protein
MDVVISLGIMALFFICSRVMVRYAFVLWNKVTKDSARTAKWRQAFEKPLRMFFLLLGSYLAIRYLLEPHGAASIVLSRLFRSSVIILMGWGMYVVSAQSSALLEDIGKRFGLDETSMLIPFLSKVIRFFIIVVVIALVGAEWGFSINGLAAGMGLGSLAIALAAKETLGNIFGGIVIILEKPFSKGDWILTPTVEGVVEDITFRSTKIRTFADAMVTVPNAALADQPITN